MSAVKTAPALTTFNVESIRADFPILHTKAHNKPLVYLDNAASSQKPQIVIDALTNYYTTLNANIHRGVHYLSQKASQEFDDVRIKVKNFINAGSEREIVFVRGTTEGINLVASSFGRKFFNEGDEVLISAMEHHSNIVPWQMICEERKAVLKVIPMNDNGEISLDEVEKLINSKTKLVSIVHTSNSLGTVNPVSEVIRLAHSKGVPVLVDAAQGIVHSVIDVQKLDCDFLVFSGHKMLGPTGVGVLYGKEKHLEAMPPYQGGGEMIHSVSFEKTTYNELPYKFEAGTPNIADVIGLGAAIDYYERLDRKAAFSHEHQLMQRTMQLLSAIPGVRLIGTAEQKASVVSFVIDGVNALDAGMYLDTMGIAVRTGHHCTEPVMQRFGIPGTIRASFMFYNTMSEVEALVKGVEKAIGLLR